MTLNNRNFFRFMFLVIIIIGVLAIIGLLLIPGVKAQGAIQTKSVYDFSGGLVNSLSNSLMQDNQAKKLEDFDVTEIGSLALRKGYRLAYSDPFSGNGTGAVFANHYGTRAKRLMILRKITGVYGSGADADSGNNNVYSLLSSNDSALTCSTLVSSGWYFGSRTSTIPYNVNTAVLPLGLVIVGTGSNMQIVSMDGKTHYAVPPIDGQPVVVALDGGGKTTGCFRYRWGYRKVNGDTTTGSAPSLPVTVTSGKVFIYEPVTITDTSAENQIVIWRQRIGRDGLDGAASTYGWHTLGAFPRSQSYLDTFPVTYSGDSTGYPCAACDAYFAGSPRTSGAAPPYMRVHLNKAGTNITMKNIGATIYGPTHYLNVQFHVQFIDSSNRVTHSAFACNSDTLSANDSIFSIAVGHIPTLDTIHFPHRQKRVMSMVIGISKVSGGYVNKTWGPYAVDTNFFGFAVATADTVTLSGTLDMNDSTGLTRWSPDGNVYNTIRDDSLLVFQPSTIAAFNSRLFAAGDVNNLNYLYYSDFGRPSCWPNDHILSLVSSHGDWINGLYPLGDRLLIFRQNSVYQFTGASFYQFQIDELASNVGLSGPRTLAGSQNEVFFAHQTGVYEIPRGGAISNEPISLPIQNSFDSTASSELTATGVVIGRDYWYSPAPGIAPRTYIYTALPKPHWKVYTFALKAATLYDPDTTAVDFASREYVLLDSYDHLLQWDYSDTTDGDAAGHQIESTIAGTYQSKYFFEGPTRTKVQYVEIEATGLTTELTVSLVCNYGQTTVSKTLTNPSWSSQKKIRIPFGQIVKNAAIRLRVEGATTVIKGYTIGYTPWDGGKL